MVPLGHPKVKGVFLRRPMNRDIQGMKKGPLGSQYQEGSLEVTDEST